MAAKGASSNVANVQVLPIPMLPVANFAFLLATYFIGNWNWLLATFSHWQHSHVRLLHHESDRTKVLSRPPRWSRWLVASAAAAH